MTESTEVKTTAPSKQREIVATVASVGVGLVLNIGASILIGKISKRVHDQIATPETTTE